MQHKRSNYVRTIYNLVEGDGKPLFNPSRIQRQPGETRKQYEARKKAHKHNVALAAQAGYFKLTRPE